MTSTSLPRTMRAWQYTSTHGGLEKNLKLNPSAALPKPKPDQHLIKVLAIALNPIDYKPAEIPGVARVAIPKPATPGIDFAGTIVKPAADSALKAGELVFGAVGSSPLAGGGLAEFAVSASKAAVAVPEGVRAVDAATVGVAGLTAYQSILPHVKKGDKLFINGGSGGTGVFGIQIAKQAGCHVTTTCSGKNAELCRSLGADRVVDYRSENVVEALKGDEVRFDHVVDNVGGNRDLWWRSHEYLKEGRLYVIVGAEPSLGVMADSMKRKVLPGFLGGVKRKVVGFWPQPNQEDLRQIGEWFRDGTVKPVIDEQFSFEQAPQAIKKLKSGRARGKIVVDVASSETEDEASS